MNRHMRNVAIENDEFANMRRDANRIIQTLLKNMVEKDALEGTVTIKVNIKLSSQYVSLPPEVWDEQGQSRRVLKPRFEHKISSVMQVNDKADGESFSDLYELIYDRDSGKYVLVPVKDDRQMTIFDIMPEDQTPIYGLPDHGGVTDADTRPEGEDDEVVAECGMIEADSCRNAENATEESEADSKPDDDETNDSEDDEAKNEEIFAESMNPPESDEKEFDYEYEEPEEFPEEEMQ